jgi:hypothetical protein
MSALSIQPTYPIFTDIDGQPLDSGYIWIGTANLNPITNPINVYWDAALTQPAAQPIRTISGYPSNAGTPARLYVNSDYSIQVQNKNGTLVYSSPVATERYSSQLITFIQAGSGAVQRTVQNKLREYVSVKDFGAVGNGIVDDTNAIKAAIDYALTVEKSVYFPAGDYLWTANNYSISVSRGFGDFTQRSLRLFGEGSNSSKFFINANGKIFNVTSQLLFNQFIVEDLSFTLLNPSINNSATCFYVSYFTGYGAHFKFNNCNFYNWTNTSVHGIRCGASMMYNCMMVGNDNYSTFDDAGVRMWGADGTLAVQEHFLSSFIVFDACWFLKFRYGIDGWGLDHSEARACNFEGNWIGLSIKRTDLATVSAISDARKSTNFALFTYNSCWFENNAKYHYADVEVDFSTGNVVNPLLTAEIYSNGTRPYLNVITNLHPPTPSIVAGDRLELFKFSDNVDTLGGWNFLDFRLLNAGANTGIVTQVRNDEAFFRQNVRAASISFGNNVFAKFRLDGYEEDNWTPTLISDGTATTFSYALQDGKFTRIGNRIFYNLTIVAGVSSAGTGNILISNLPFPINSFDNYSGGVVTDKDRFTTNGPDAVRSAPASGGLLLVYDNNTSMSNIVVANVTDPAGIEITVSGFYETNT